MSKKDLSKLGHSTITHLDYRSQQDIDYTEAMARKQRETNPVVVKPVQPEGMTREAWIESMQPQSTRNLMAKHRDPNYVADLSAPLPDNVLANPTAKSTSELIGQRVLDPKEASHVEAIRRRPKNSLGQSSKRGTDKPTRQHAAHAFEFSPPAKVTREEEALITELVPTQSTTPETLKERWVPMTPWQAFKHWLGGGKVEKRENERITYGAWLEAEAEGTGKKDEDDGK